MNQRVLHVLAGVAFVLITAFVILPFLPQEIRPRVAPVEEVKDGDSSV